MSDLWKSEKELRQERWQQEVLSRLKDRAQQSRETTAEHVAAVERAGRLQTAAFDETLSNQTTELVGAAYGAADLVANQITQAIAEDWLLHARGKARRAAELWAGGMLEEAWQLAKEAIQEDPGHLPAYGLAAGLHYHQGEFEEAERLYRKQITLLRIASYCHDLGAAITVLRRLPPHGDLLAEYATCARSLLAAETWMQGDWEGLILLLLARGLRDLAKDVAEIAAKRSPSLKLHALHLDLSGCSEAAQEGLARFISSQGGFQYQRQLAEAFEQLRGGETFSAEVLEVIYEALLRRQLKTLASEPALSNHVFHLDFSKQWVPGQENLAAYLAGVTEIERQNTLLTELGNLFGLAGAAHDPNLLLVHSLMARQFKEWQPLRQRHHEQIAAGRAAKAVKAVGHTVAIVVLLVVLVGCFNGFVLASSALGRVGFFLAAVTIVVGALAGWSMNYDHMLQQRLQGELEPLQALERQ